MVSTSGLPLKVSRSYDSARPVDGPAGVGWTLNIPSRLFYAAYMQSQGAFRREADVTMPDGSRYRFKENADGVTFTPPSGRFEALVKNGDGSFDLTPQKTRQRYHFSSTGALMSMTDDGGNTINLIYDGSGRLQQVADASGSGRYVNLYYGADGRVSAVQDSGARQVQYFYDSAGLLTSVVDAAGRATAYAYVQTGTGPLLSQIADGFGRISTAVGYGANCNVDTLTSLGQTYKYTFSPNQTTKRPLTTSDHWLFTFTDDGLITSRTQIYGSSGNIGPRQLTDYTPEGLVQQQTDEAGIRTGNTYDGRGNLASVTRDYQGAQAVRFDYAYDAAFPDKVVSVTPANASTGAVDPDWQAWRYDYYPPGSPSAGSLFHVYRVRSDGPADTMATHLYDSSGRLTRVTNAAGSATDYAYDAAGDLTAVTAPANNDVGTRPITSYGYDSLGRATSVTDPLGHTTVYAYDAADRITAVTLPRPSAGSPLNFTTTFSYDNYDSPSGLLFTVVSDPNGRVTRQGYDQLGRLVESIDTLGNAANYTYSQGHLTSIRDANGNVTTYTYTSLTGGLSKVTFPDGAVEEYAYYNDGQLATKYLRRGSVSYEYDRLKRLTKKTSDVTDWYTYAGQNLMSVAHGDNGVIDTHSFTHDGAGRLVVNAQGNRGTISYLYNGDDSLASYAVAGGPTATHGYYPDGSLRTIQWTPVAGEFRFEYTLAGQQQRLSFPNGQTRNSSYDDQGRLAQVSNLDPVAGTIATHAYGYDLNQGTGQYDELGQRVSVTATVPSQGLTNQLTRYEYDPLYQLSRVTYPNIPPFAGEVDSWTYDPIGNRLTSVVNGTTQAYSYKKVTGNSNNWQRLLSDGVNSYSYDPDGNTTSKSGPNGTLNLSWYTEDRLKAMSGAATASYAYDYQGRRAMKTVSGTPTTYLYDGLNLLSEAGSTRADYLFGPGIDEPLAMTRNGHVYYYATDALGSVTAVTDSGGAVQTSYLYDAWGQTKVHTGSLANPLGYTGREFAEAGTLFYRARYESPDVARFLSEDPSRFAQGVNWYSYVRNSPIELTDPTGLTIRQCFRPFGGLLAIATVGILISPPIPGNNWCPMHEYLFNSDNGQVRDFDPYRARAHESGSNLFCYDLPEPLGTCVWNTIASTGTGGGPYDLLEHNCQSSIETAKQRCGSTPCLPTLFQWSIGSVVRGLHWR
jgi:RHS repeat-associated protein